MRWAETSLETKKAAFDLSEISLSKALNLLQSLTPPPSTYEATELLSLIGKMLCDKKETSTFPSYVEAISKLPLPQQESLLVTISAHARKETVLDELIGVCPQKYPSALEILYAQKIVGKESLATVMKEAPQELRPKILLRVSPEIRSHFFSSSHEEINPIQKIAIGRAFLELAKDLSIQERMKLQKKLLKAVSPLPVEPPQIPGLFARIFGKKPPSFEDSLEKSLISYLDGHKDEVLSLLKEKNQPGSLLLRIADRFRSNDNEESFIDALSEHCSLKDALEALTKTEQEPLLYSFHKKLALVLAQNAKTAREILKAPPQTRKALLTDFFSSDTIPIQDLVQDADTLFPLFSRLETREVCATLIQRFLTLQENDERLAVWKTLDSEKPFLQLVRSSILLHITATLREKKPQEIMSTLTEMPAPLAKEVLLKLLSSELLPIEAFLELAQTSFVEKNLLEETLPIVFNRIEISELNKLKNAPQVLRHKLFEIFKDKATPAAIFKAAEALAFDQKDIALQLKDILPKDFSLDKESSLGKKVLIERLYSLLPTADPAKCHASLSSHPEEKTALLTRLFQEKDFTFLKELFSLLRLGDQQTAAPIFAEKVLENEPFDQEEASKLILSDLPIETNLLRKLGARIDEEAQKKKILDSFLLEKKLSQFTRMPESLQKQALEFLSLEEQMNLLDKYAERNSFLETVVASIVRLNSSSLSAAVNTIQKKETSFRTSVLQRSIKKIATILFGKEPNEIAQYPKECLKELFSLKALPLPSLVALLDALPEESLHESLFSALATRIREEPLEQIRKEALLLLPEAKQIGERLSEAIAQQKIKEIEENVTKVIAERKAKQDDTLILTEKYLVDVVLKEEPFLRKHLLKAVFSSSIDPFYLLRTADSLIKKLSYEEIDILATLLSKKLPQDAKQVRTPNPDIALNSFHERIVASQNPQKIITLENLSLKEQMDLLDDYAERDSFLKTVVDSIVNFDPTPLSAALNTIREKDTEFRKKVLQQSINKIKLKLVDMGSNEIALYPEECLKALFSSKGCPLSLLIPKFKALPKESLRQSLSSTLAQRIEEEPSQQKREEAERLLKTPSVKEKLPAKPLPPPTFPKEEQLLA